MSGIPWRWLMMVGAACLVMEAGWAADKPTVFDEESLQVDVPQGWKESQQDTAGSDSVGGWESSDRKTSFYVIKLPTQNDMRTALDQFIDIFDQDENWQIQKVGEFRSIKLGELPASYVQVDLELVAGDRKVPFEFHFAMVGGTGTYYLLQGSVMKPVWKPRRDEIFRMMKSFREKKAP